MAKKPKQFDGSLALVVQGDLKLDTINENLFFYSEDLGKYIPVDPKCYSVTAVFDYLKSLHSQGRKEGRPSRRTQLQELMQTAKQAGELAAQSEYPEMYQTLEKGRLKLSLLLNTRGGETYVESQIQLLIKNVLSKGGELTSLGGDDIKSAGANLFMQPFRQKRFLKPESNLKFHLSAEASGFIKQRTNPDGNIITITEAERQKMVRQEMAEIRSLLLKNVAIGKRAELEGILDMALTGDSSKSPDHPIELTGKQAAQFGLARKTNNLASEFGKIHDVTSDTYSGTKIADFFG